MAVGGASKRAVDLIGAALALLLLTPIFILTCLLIRFLIGKPAIVIERCVGLGGRAFSQYKFRSNRSAYDGGTLEGGGDYRQQDGSPALAVAQDEWVNKWDPWGRYRPSDAPPGAFAPEPKKTNPRYIRRSAGR